ncbi:MAG TPA: hypothetical protein VFS43_22305 [Polyangiaceae bacterium]|nr:hypothetical protein [Polyangiaceae bacterium]
MLPSPFCQRVPLASGPVARLEFCAHCQALSLHLGALTLRFDRDAAASLLETLSEALGALGGGRHPKPGAGLTRGAA